MSADAPPRLGASYLKKALLAALLIMVLSGGAVSAAGIITANDLLSAPADGRAAIPGVEREIDPADIDGPRTLLLLGTDGRYGDTDRARADTMVLVRLDPDGQAIAMTSIPRDLQAQIPGVGREKINLAYHEGGPRMTLKVIKDLLSTPEQPFEINHVLEVDFSGFRRAIDYIGCVYVDIDRDYYNPPESDFATIDIDPGYQRICGRDALDYVRYRHGDNDLVRNARQQDFLRQVKDQSAVQKVMSWDRRREVIRLVDRYLRTDRKLREDRRTVVDVLRLVFYTKDKPVVSVPFKSRAASDNINLVASDGDLRSTVRQFIAAGGARPATTAGADRPARRPKPRRPARERKTRDDDVPGLQDMRVAGQDQAVLAATRRLRVPLYYPELGPVGAQYDHKRPRLYPIRDETGKLRPAYRMIFKKTGPPDYYFGIQGTAWTQPPILDRPSEKIRRNGRTLELFYEGKRLRIVAWRTDQGAYWVSNSLTKSLDNRQMIAIAASLRRLRGK